MTKIINERLSEHWDVLTRPGRIGKFVSAPWAINVNTWYDGGEISLLAKGNTVLTVKREVEFGRMDISIPEELEPSRDRLLALLDRVIDKCLEEAASEKALTEKSRNAEISALLDDFDTDVKGAETAWCICERDQYNGSRWKSGPYFDINAAMEDLHEGEISVEISEESSGGNGHRAFFRSDKGEIEWLDAAELEKLRHDNASAPSPV